MKELRIFFLLSVVFLLFYFFPIGVLNLNGPFYEALALTQWYARKHVLLCLVPAFFIAGAISVFLSQNSVIKYLGPDANKFVSYGVASVSGTILAVCSCTVLPIFSGIYKRGAGLGPATAFLYSGPAINVLAIILTARVLGWKIGLARAVGAILFSLVIGILMHLIFRNEKKNEKKAAPVISSDSEEERPLWKNAVYFLIMVVILVFANWGNPGKGVQGLWGTIFNLKWIITGLAMAILLYMIVKWFKKDELKDWTVSSWDFTKQILPLLFAGVIVSGFFLGRPGHNGIIPSGIIESLVGGNSIFANFFASVVAALMYFATLTEIPILEGLIGAGMGNGPALALLLAGPALSLPNMIVIKSVLGTKKTLVFITLVVVMATFSGYMFGLMNI